MSLVMVLLMLTGCKFSLMGEPTEEKKATERAPNENNKGGGSSSSLKFFNVCKRTEQIKIRLEAYTGKSCRDISLKDLELVAGGMDLQNQVISKLKLDSD